MTNLQLFEQEFPELVSSITVTNESIAQVFVNSENRLGVRFACYDLEEIIKDGYRWKQEDQELTFTIIKADFVRPQPDEFYVEVLGTRNLVHRIIVTWNLFCF